MSRTVLNLILVLTLLPCFASASLKCQNLFVRNYSSKYTAKALEVAKLYEDYPAYKKLVTATLENIRTNEPSNTKPAAELEDMIFYNTVPEIREIERNISPEVKKDLIVTYNALENKFMLIKYIKTLLEDAGVLMMKEADQKILKRFDMENAQSQLTTEKTTKRHYLEIGQVDHNSLKRVLTNRILARGDKLSVILRKEHGSYDKNKTHNYKHDDFFGVLRVGPFFDLEFRKGQAHGQDVHLLQMDYVEQVLSNRKEFWLYVTGATAENKQAWAWDRLFDGWDSSYRQPEFLGPILRQTLPIY